MYYTLCYNLKYGKQIVLVGMKFFFMSDDDDPLLDHVEMISKLGRS